MWSHSHVQRTSWQHFWWNTERQFDNSRNIKTEDSSMRGQGTIRWEAASDKVHIQKHTASCGGGSFLFYIEKTIDQRSWKINRQIFLSPKYTSKNTHTHNISIMSTRHTAASDPYTYTIQTVTLPLWRPHLTKNIPITWAFRVYMSCL